LAANPKNPIADLTRSTGSSLISTRTEVSRAGYRTWVAAGASGSSRHSTAASMIVTAAASA
jgi:hypothetical protein